MRVVLLFILVGSIMVADDYSFDMSETKVKNYEHQGYIKAEHKHQKTKKDKYIDSYFGELLFGFEYFQKNFSLNTKFQANYLKIENKEENKQRFNELYISYKFSPKHKLNIGKESLKWGKGYFFNPVAFLDRKKDPNNPEVAKEGYIFARYTYNKSYDSSLKNFSFDMIFMPTTKDINDDFYSDNSTNIASKAYFLYLDTDIDILYLQSDKQANRYGFDFSKNIQTNFEVHGEMTNDSNSSVRYLLGIKYLTQSDLTITSEYFYQKKESNNKVPFYDNRYFINKLSLKEPLDIIYSQVYLKNSLNIKDSSSQNSLGFVYKFKDSLEFDISYIKNIGEKSSEFESKNITDTIWTKVSWYF